MMRLMWATLPLLALTAPAAAQSYRAVGNEPFWRLTIDGATMRLEQAGERTIVVPRPPAQQNSKGERYVGRGISVETVRTYCSDGMSDRTYRDMVMVAAGARKLMGCGSPVPGAPAKPAAGTPTARPSAAVNVPPKPTPSPTKPVATSAPKPAPVTPAKPTAPAKPIAPAPGSRSILTNTHWTVWQVNGRALPGGQPLNVNFTTNRVEGKLCNRFGGPYSIAGDKLQVGNVAATRMTCKGPVMAAETTLFTMWHAPVRATVSKWGTLILAGGRDKITLRPAH